MQFNLAPHGQPSSNESYGWNFAGMLLTGFGSVLIKGCPPRQLVVAGEGDTDGAVTVFGMLTGAALVQNWSLAGNSAGTPPAAQMAVVAGLLMLLAIGLLKRRARLWHRPRVPDRARLTAVGAVTEKAVTQNGFSRTIILLTRRVP